MIKVFVYGSLKRGYWNNTLLRDSKFLHNATTVDSKFDMYDLGSFPAVVRGVSKIYGEVYSIDEETLSKLDALEGNGSFYNREEILVDCDGEHSRAWIYIFCGTGSRSRRENVYLEGDVISWGKVV